MPPGSDIPAFVALLRETLADRHVAVYAAAPPQRRTKAGMPASPTRPAVAPRSEDVAEHEDPVPFIHRDNAVPEDAPGQRAVGVSPYFAAAALLDSRLACMAARRNRAGQGAPG